MKSKRNFINLPYLSIIASTITKNIYMIVYFPFIVATNKLIPSVLNLIDLVILYALIPSPWIALNEGLIYLFVINLIEHD